MTRDRVESIAVSLVREYLSRKGFKQTLKVLDKEFPRTEDSINNRLILAKEMHIERLMRKNKELSDPFRTMIEVLVSYMTEKVVSKSDSSGSLGSGRESTSADNKRIGSPKAGMRRSSSLQDIGLTNSNKRTSLSRTSVEDDVFKRSERDHVTERDQEVKSQGIHRGSLNQLPSSQSKYSEEQNFNKFPFDNKGIRNGLPNNPSERRAVEGEDALVKSTTKQRSRLSAPLVSTVDRKRSPKSPKKPIDLSFLDAPPNNSLNQRRDDWNLPKQKTPQDLQLAKKEILDPISQENRKLKHSLSSDSGKKIGDIMFDDIEDDLDEDMNKISIGPSAGRKMKTMYADSKPITLEAATEVKNVIFGASNVSFKSEWSNQSLHFCEVKNLEYGIVQLKGGPCGVLAAVQAVFLKFLLFQTQSARRLRRPPCPSSEEIADSLSNAIADILWRAGSHRLATVTLPSPTAKFSGGGRYKSDGLTETLVLYSFIDRAKLVEFLSESIPQFQNKSSPGCILLLYSAILSRGINGIKTDMDEANGTLIGSHGYCTQELVNLLLTGRAVSNVFDNIVELDSGGLHKSVLKGIDEQSDIGFLSLFEHYGSCQVGENYKNPKFPIWVVCSESHFSVLFSTTQETLSNRSKRHVDLYYYDGLARQDEEIRLTVDFTKPWKYDDEADDLIPPLELCIRTRWKNSSISWNGTEPIL